jgi:hypothetical protein
VEGASPASASGSSTLMRRLRGAAGSAPGRVVTSLTRPWPSATGPLAARRSTRPVGSARPRARPSSRRARRWVVARLPECARRASRPTSREGRAGAVGGAATCAAADVRAGAGGAAFFVLSRAVSWTVRVELRGAEARTGERATMILACALVVPVGETTCLTACCAVRASGACARGARLDGLAHIAWVRGRGLADSAGIAAGYGPWRGVTVVRRRAWAESLCGGAVVRKRCPEEASPCAGPADERRARCRQAEEWRERRGASELRARPWRLAQATVPRSCMIPAARPSHLA